MNRTILIVDDEPNNLSMMKAVLAGEKYKLLFAKTGEQCLKLVKKKKVDLILLDIMMPNMDGYEVCRYLKDDPLTMKTPVIFVSAMTEGDDELKGFTMGAVDYISKPIQPALLKARVKIHLSLVRIADLEQSQKSAVQMLAEAGHYNDTDTGFHIWRMADYAAAIAREVGWNQDDTELIRMAAPMHDTGKIGMPDAILKAPRKLTDVEWITMRKHTEIGYEILSKSDVPLFQMAAIIALSHHEKWDGSGYPHKKTHDEIPESAKIVAIADVFDALTMKRPYKDEWPVDKALSTIQAGAGSHFDPEFVKAFMGIKHVILSIMERWNDQLKA
ncbi:MAG: HD domain-containing phosphohydrolase [Leptospirales bacterium]